MTKKSAQFILIFGIIFVLSFTVLYFLGLIPNELLVNTNSSNPIDKLNQDSLQSIVGGNNINNSVNTIHEDPIRITAFPRFFNWS